MAPTKDITEIRPTDDEGMKALQYFPSKEPEKAPTPELYEQQSRFSVEEIEKVSPTPVNEHDKVAIQSPGRFKRAWAHIKRHWILYTLGSLVTLAVTIVLTILVIIPAVVRAIVKNNALPVYSAGLTNPTPDQIDVSLHSSLHVPAGLSARMDAQTLGFYIDAHEKMPFLEVDLPEYYLKGTSQLIITNQTRPILNQTAFTSFLINSLNTRNFTMYVRSKTTIHLGSLKTKVDINKGIRIPGLNSMAGFQVSNLELNNNGLVAHAVLPNASPFQLEMGNLTQNVYLGSTLLGNGVIQDAALYPFHNSTYALTVGSLNIAGALNNMSQLISYEGGALMNGKILLTTNNNQTTYDGQNITYFAQTLGQLRLPIELDLAQVLQTTNINLTGTTGGSGNGTGTSSVVDEFLGGSGNGSVVSQVIKGMMQGIAEEAGSNLGNLLSGLLGGILNTKTNTQTTKIEDLDELAILES